jgi:hypothetical protein
MKREGLGRLRPVPANEADVADSVVGLRAEIDFGEAYAVIALMVFHNWRAR